MTNALLTDFQWDISVKHRMPQTIQKIKSSLWSGIHFLKSCLSSYKTKESVPLLAIFLLHTGTSSHFPILPFGPWTVHHSGPSSIQSLTLATFPVCASLKLSSWTSEGDNCHISLWNLVIGGILAADFQWKPPFPPTTQLPHLNHAVWGFHSLGKLFSFSFRDSSTV